jgi:DNA-binding NtrC family response regulator
VPEEANLFGSPEQLHPSRLDEAAGGTLFLDEVADLPLAQQARLAGVLARQADSTKAPAAWIVATTSKDVESLVASGLFDVDLCRSFSPMVINLPPLRERQQDVPALVHYFVTRDLTNASITAEALAVLCEYSWPGNVRELEETILQALVLAKDAGPGAVIDLPHLKLGTGSGTQQLSGLDWTDLVPLHDGWRENIDKLEKALVIRSLSLSKGNKSKAAEALRIHRRLLYEKLRQFQMSK